MAEAASARSRPQLVGREQATAAALGVASAARATGGVVLVTGEAGLGKTSLLAHLAARLDDWVIIRAQADSFEADLSYSTIETLVRTLNVRTNGVFTRPRPDDDAITVGRALLDGIDALAEPVCLVIDDAQWVDEPSARALRFLLRRIPGQPFLLIVATRPEANSLAASVADLAPEFEASAEITLAAFTVPETQQLAQQILGHSISLRTATRLTEATQGSPLLLRMLLRQLRASITGASHPAGWEMPVPETAPLAATVTAALVGASASTRTAAELIAVLRDPVPLPQLGTIAERLGARVDLDGAIARGLVHSDERDGVTWLEPAHGMLADALVAGIGRERRAGIHRVAAEVLSGHRALRHRVEAADRSDSGLVDELLAATHEAAELGQSSQAMSYARSAVHLAPGGAARERCLLEIGLLAMRTRLHERIFDLHPELENLPPSLTRDAILVELRILTGDVVRARDLAVSALKNDDPSADARVLRSRVAGALPKIQLAMRDFTGVLTSVDDARRVLALAPTDPADVADAALRWMVEPEEELLRLLGWQITAGVHTSRVDITLAASEELDRLTATAHDSSGLTDALVTGSRVAISAGQLQKARAGLERANRLLRLFPDSWTAGHARCIYAHVLFLLGEWDESVTVADSAVALALDETDLSGWPIALNVSTLVRAARGEERAVTERLAQAEQATPGVLGSYDPELPIVARAELARALDRRSQQLAATDGDMPDAAAATTMGWLSYRIDALAALGRAAEAREALALCTAPGSRWRPYHGSLAWLTARVAEAEGQTDAALAHYAAAYDSPDAPDFPHPTAVAMLDAARLLAAHRRGAEAVALAERAAATFRRLGASEYLERCSHLLTSLAGAASNEHGDPFADLTTRERQVAHAVVSGMTNKEVAERLYVSVTTVNFHVRNILAKLGITSRRELRRLALEHRAVHRSVPVKS
ncbi:LuxR C-terminal-related transcriptional regulator [Microbacterium sp. STN6]|uniref:helix-turn-helix transcriptional regulator n=1 Tax=Microbacterium sp. STN6 TaxID=2995588 RepID=UPI002260B4AB|nr:LuxR family transcriptional regulator [Microbacterium sp. STN6]MCX7521789.1 LuxR C-terminal-related transcriptional regulator [Microbacterium sp. STN6]